jgi:hypothetical protein
MRLNNGAPRLNATLGVKDPEELAGILLGRSA